MERLTAEERERIRRSAPSGSTVFLLLDALDAAEQEVERLRKVVEAVIGATITNVDVTIEDTGMWTVLHVLNKAGEKFTLEISQDEEG